MIRRGFPAQGSPRKIFSLSFPARQGMREAALPGPLASPWRPPRPPARQPSPDPAAPRRGTACAAPAARGCGLRHGLVRLRPADPSCGGWNKSFRDFGAGKSRANIGGACPMQTYGQGSAGGRSFERVPIGQSRRPLDGRGFQPEGEVLLQICCRCSDFRSPTQLSVVAGGSPGAPARCVSTGRARWHQHLREPSAACLNLLRVASSCSNHPRRRWQVACFR
jgi:hypothetical protein